MDFCFNLFRLKCVNPLPRPVPDSACYVLIKSFPLPTWYDYKSGLPPHTSSSSGFLYLSICICAYWCNFYASTRAAPPPPYKKSSTPTGKKSIICSKFLLGVGIFKCIFHHVCFCIFWWNHKTGKSQVFEEDFLNVIIMVVFTTLDYDDCGIHIPRLWYREWWVGWELWIIGIGEYSSCTIIWIADTVRAVSRYPQLSAIQYHIHQIANTEYRISNTKKVVLIQLKLFTISY